ncbi:complement factor H-related protein 2-like isoform X2 [Erythrolamprus reginae]|uniref:complement factor H-related protein 2-like isoform X2 n=1 Tax=Erythrolamprus reginae TaxID=121349 RepID=UPI00396CE2B0
MKLSQVAVFLLWPGFSSQNACNEPDEIDFGEIVSTEKAKYLENDRVQYRCNPSYVLEGPEWIQCKGEEWTPHPPKCLAPCSITRQQLAAKNLSVFGSQRKAQLIQSNQSLQFQCNEGYVLVVPSVRKCIDGYMDFPLCISDSEGGCGRPPAVDNGDIIDTLKETYLQSESVNYQCQNFYIMEGSSRVTCQDGRWSQTPTCRAPCTASGEDMREHNIKLKWNNGDKIYSEDGDVVEFECRRDYKPHPNTTSFRVTCMNGKLDFPDCIPVDSEEGCGRPPPVDNGDIIDTLKETYLQSESVNYQCQNFYIMEGSSRVTCQNGHWSQTPTCRAPCTASGEDMREHNIKLKWNNGDKIYSEDGDVVEFECRRDYKPHPNTRSFRVTCMNGKLDFPDCIPVDLTKGTTEHAHRSLNQKMNIRNHLSFS